MRTRRLLSGILILLVLAIFGLLFWAAKDSGPGLPLATQYPDGSSVKVIKVVYGKQLKIPRGNYWQRAAAGILPLSFSRRLGLKVDAYTNATDTVLIAIENTRTNGTFSGGMAMAFNFSTGMDVSDDAGNAYSISPVFQVGKASNDVIEVFAEPLVSHIATNLTLRLRRSAWGPSITNYSSEFVVPNPAPHRKPAWTPSPLPVTNQLDDLSIVLSGFAYLPPSITLISPISMAEIKVFERGVALANWSVVGFTAQDEEGNVSGPDAHFSPGEPRKFRVELLHTFPAGPRDILTLGNLPLADANHAFTPVQTNFGTNIITISRLALGQITYTIKPGLKNVSCRLAILYTDDSGHTYTALNDVPMGPFGANLGFSRKNTNAVKSADITFTFAATSNRFVEFLALPEPAPTNSSTTK